MRGRRRLHSIGENGGYAGGVSIHGGRGGNGGVWQPGSEAGQLGQVIDRARSHGHNCLQVPGHEGTCQRIDLGIAGHGRFPPRTPGDQILLRARTLGNESIGDLPARYGPGDLISHDQPGSGGEHTGQLAPHAPEQVRGHHKPSDALCLTTVLQDSTEISVTHEAVAPFGWNGTGKSTIIYGRTPCRSRRELGWIDARHRNVADIIT